MDCAMAHHGASIDGANRDERVQFAQATAAVRAPPASAQRIAFTNLGGTEFQVSPADFGKRTPDGTKIPCASATPRRGVGVKTGLPGAPVRMAASPPIAEMPRHSGIGLEPEKHMFHNGVISCSGPPLPRVPHYRPASERGIAGRSGSKLSLFSSLDPLPRPFR
jgi:hypothetical protein